MKLTKEQSEEIKSQQSQHHQVYIFYYKQKEQMKIFLE
jgi:hypothetical protein